MFLNCGLEVWKTLMDSLLAQIISVGQSEV